GGWSIWCDVCETIMVDVENFVTADTTEEELYEFLDNVCDIFPDFFVEECDSIINQYIDQVVDLIMSDYPPDVVCEMIGLCDAVIESPVLEDSLLCTICDLIVEMAEEWITADTTVEEVEEWLDGVCDLLPSFMARECNKWINSEVDQLVTLLLDDYPADVVCAEMGACDSMVGAPVLENSLMCTVCDMIVDLAEHWITHGTSVHEVEKWLEGVCHLLPSFLGRECKRFIDKEIEELAQMLVDDLPADVICADLGACDKGIEGDDLFCEMCDDIMQLLEDDLEDDATEEEIEAWLDQVCAKLGLSKLMERTCDATINKYFEQIVDMLVNDYPADTVCEMLGICGDNLAAPVLEDSIVCTICDLVVEMGEEWITSGTTVQEVEDWLE
ncbi:saposin, partial [Kipferlia bialata]